jgi:hypothetical protein
VTDGLRTARRGGPPAPAGPLNSPRGSSSRRRHRPASPQCPTRGGSSGQASRQARRRAMLPTVVRLTPYSRPMSR